MQEVVAEESGKSLTGAQESDAHVCRLIEKGRIFREAFLAKLGLLLRGTVAAPPERYGETLADEHIRGGTHLVLTMQQQELVLQFRVALWYIPLQCQ